LNALAANANAFKALAALDAFRALAQNPKALAALASEEGLKATAARD
jgi:hypothetical protein